MKRCLFDVVVLPQIIFFDVINVLFEQNIRWRYGIVRFNVPLDTL